MIENKSQFTSSSLTNVAWQRFKKNGLGMFGLVTIGLFLIVAVLGYLLTPDSSPDANEQLLELSKKRPGFEVKVLLCRKNEASHKVNIFSKMVFGEVSDFRSIPFTEYRFDGNDIVVNEFAGEKNKKGQEIRINVADVLYSINPEMHMDSSSKAGLVSFYELEKPEKISRTVIELQNEIVQKNIVSRKFILGTDPAGRDLLSRLIIGIRVSFSVGFIAVFISVFIGILLGSLSGYFKGWVDEVIMWFINVVWSVPTLLLVIAITLILGKGFWQVFIAVGLTMWVEVARVVRGQILSLREKEFIEAGKALGFTNFRIITRHVLPNVLGPVIVISASNFAAAILIEAGLSFLGIGAQPPTASWGAMINSHRGYIIGDSPYLAFLPGIAIMLIVLAFVLLGNGLRDSLDRKVVNEDKLMY